MGSLSMTCSVSGLGIDAGTPVRVFLLTESPYGEGWSIRTPPLRAHYNDYGSIECVHPEDLPIANLWLRAFREDLVEMGAGDNQCHDVPVRKEMTFDELLGVLQKGRVFVRQDTEHFWRRPRKRLRSEQAEEHASLTPTFQKIEQLLESDPELQAEFGGKVTGSGLFCGKFVVDEPRPHAVRVRWEKRTFYDSSKKYSPEEETVKVVAQLDKVKRIAEQAGFVGCIIASTDCVQGSVELVVFAPPSHALFHAGPEWHTGKDAPLRVALAMVREDVWQALCRFPQRDSVSLDCTNCGQQSSYHSKQLHCPDKSINGKLFKTHDEDSKYEHGPVFPANVCHRVVRRPYGEDVWYGIDVYKHVVHEVWASIVEYFREKTPAEHRAAERQARKTFGEVERAGITKVMAKARQKQADKLAAMTPEARVAYDAQGEELRAQGKREKIEKQKNPVFGDFLFDGGTIGDFCQPGAWILRHSVPGVISVGNHLSMLLADRKLVSRALLDSIAELAAVTDAIRQARKVWEPVSSTGSQFPEWDLHLRHLKMLMQVAEAEIAEHNASVFRDEDDPLMQCAPLTFDEVLAWVK